MSHIIRNIGNDFGTSTTFVCWLDHQNGRPMQKEPQFVTFDGNPLLRTLIYDLPVGERLFGMKAAQQAKRDQNPTGLVRNFKMQLEDPSTRADAEARVTQLFRYLRDQYIAQLSTDSGGKPEECTFVSFPAKWGGDLRDVVIKAAVDAGFRKVQGMDEPSAAMQFFLAYNRVPKELVTVGKPLTVLLVDMGAGTTDLVLYRTDLSGEGEVLNTWPKAGGPNFGGRDIDAGLADYIREYLVRNGYDPKMALEDVTDWVDEIIAFKELDVSPTLARGETAKHFAPLGNRYLSKLLRPEREAFGIDRARFGRLFASQFKTLVSLVNGLMADPLSRRCLSRNTQIDLLILTGGHSQWWFVREISRGRWVPGLTGTAADGSGIVLPKLQADYSNRVVTHGRPQELVARGLAVTGLTIANRASASIKPRAAHNLQLKLEVARVFFSGHDYEFRANPHSVAVISRGTELPHQTAAYVQLPFERLALMNGLTLRLTPIYDGVDGSPVEYTFECSVKAQALDIVKSLPKALWQALREGSDPEQVWVDDAIYFYIEVEVSVDDRINYIVGIDLSSSKTWQSVVRGRDRPEQAEMDKFRKRFLLKIG